MIKSESFNEFIDFCKQRVKLDQTELGVDCEFLPNPKICSKPLFCLIGMEPSVKNGGLTKTREEIQQGYQNFLTSAEDFILHFCAYNFLCNQTFNYYITDLSKGAMTTDDARRTASQRYPNWLELLRDELRLLGNPITIVIGNSLNVKLEKLGYTADYHIPHYSWSGSRWIKKIYENLNPCPFWNKFDHIESEIHSFSDMLMKHAEYTEEMRINRLNGKFEHYDYLRPWRIRLFAVYKSMFQEIYQSHFA